MDRPGDCGRYCTRQFWASMDRNPVTLLIIIVMTCGFLEYAGCDLLATTGAITCMTQQEMLACNKFGTDLSLIASLQDDPRCHEARQIVSSTGAIANRSTNNDDSLIKTKQCPCKPNHSGHKCDTCHEGFYVRFHHIREDDRPPSDYGMSRLDDNKLRPPTTIYWGNKTHQTRKTHRSFSCQACNCDPFGAKSLNCDKRNGTCFCIDGYTGWKCDKCSLGYYNASAVLDMAGNNLEQSSALIGRSRRRHCIECGECFDQWHVTVIDLKNTGIELIKRAFELTSGAAAPSQSSFLRFMGQDSIGLPTASVSDEGESPAHTDKSDSFDGLDEKLRSISERVFTNKQNSDKLNLLASEFDSVASSYERTKSNAFDLKKMKGHLEARIIRLNYYTEFVSLVVGDRLGKLVNKFERDQLSAQEDLPRGALILIQMYSNTSSITREASIKFQQEVKPNLENLKMKLETELASLNRSHSELQEICQKLLAESLTTHRIDSVSFFADLNSILSTNHLKTNSSAKMHIHHRHQLDLSIALKLLDRELKSRVSDCLIRTQDDRDILTKLDTLIREILTMLEKTDDSLGQFHSSWLSFLTSSPSGDIGAIEPWTIYAELENSSKLLQNNSDRFEAKLKQLDHIFSSNETYDSEIGANYADTIQSIRLIVQNIRVALDNRSSQWNEFELIHKGELLQLNSLKRRASSLFNESVAMEKDLNSIRNINKEADRLQNSSVQLLNRTSQESESLLMSFIVDNTELNLLLNESSLISQLKLVNHEDQNNIETIRSRYLGVKTKFFERKLIFDHQATKIRGLIDNTTKENENLLHELEERSSELSSLKIAAKSVYYTGPNLSATAINLTSDGSLNETINHGKNHTEKEVKLSRKLRAQRLVMGIEELVRDLVSVVSRTNSLGEEFKENERVLTSQNKTLHLLQDELEHLTTELESSLTADCNSTCRSS